MRISVMIAVLLLLGAQTTPASAGMRRGMAISMVVPCGQASSPWPHPLCRDLAAVLLGPASGLGLSLIEPIRQRAWTLAVAGLPRAAALPPIPVQQPAWRRHMDKVVAGYDNIFGARGPVVLPAAPALLWPAGDPIGSETE